MDCIPFGPSDIENPSHGVEVNLIPLGTSDVAQSVLGE